MNSKLKKKKKIKHGIKVVFLYFYAIIFASQCFAESSSNSTSKINKRSQQYMEMMNGVFDFVQRNYVDEVDPETLYTGALKGMLSALNDPYTIYLDNSTFRSLNDTTKGKFGGVGLSISKAFISTPEKPAYVEVASPVEDTPGFKAGIQAGDLIISANGTDTSKITMDEVLDILRGPVGEKVDLVIRRGQNIEFPVTLKREMIEVPTVKFGTIKEVEKAGTVGYVRIIEFTPQTAERVQQALDSFKKEKISALIIDLRNNPGGLITSVVDVADKFIDQGPIVSTKSRLAFENSVFTASPRKTTFKKDIPIIVLINKGSASASEILSGALKDNHLAYLVGQRTYGKGSVQQVIPLGEDEAIKMTIARYYTPSDTNIDKIGIPPDLEIKYPPLTEAEEKAYSALLESNKIDSLIEENPKMTEEQIRENAEILKKEFNLDSRLLRRLIRMQIWKFETGHIYDLDYDIQLTAALDILKTKDFKMLVSSTKTLKELQQEAEAMKLSENQAD